MKAWNDIIGKCNCPENQVQADWAIVLFGFLVGFIIGVIMCYQIKKDQYRRLK